MGLQRRVQRFLGVAVGDQLDAAEQPPAPDIADIRMLPERGFQTFLQTRTHGVDVFHQAGARHDLDHLVGGCGGDGVADIGVAVLEQARAVPERVIDLSRKQRRPDRLIAAAETLGDGGDIGADAFLFLREDGAGPAHAAHHLVEDQQHTVAVADLADAPEIAGHRRHRAKRRADHRLGNEGDDLIGAEFEDLVLQLLRQPGGIIVRRLFRALVAPGVAGRDVMRLGQDRLELRPPPGIAAGRQRADGIAVIALPAGDDMAALRLADLDEILPRHLQRRLDRLGPARDEIDIVQPLGRQTDQPLGQRFRRVGGEE